MQKRKTVNAFDYVTRETWLFSFSLNTSLRVLYSLLIIESSPILNGYVVRMTTNFNFKNSSYKTQHCDTSCSTCSKVELIKIYENYLLKCNKQPYLRKWLRTKQGCDIYISPSIINRDG